MAGWTDRKAYCASEGLGNKEDTEDRRPRVASGALCLRPPGPHLPSFVSAFLAPAFHGKQPTKASLSSPPSPLKVTRLEPRLGQYGRLFMPVISSLGDSGPWSRPICPVHRTAVASPACADRVCCEAPSPACGLCGASAGGASGVGAPGSPDSLTFPLCPPFTVTVTRSFVCDTPILTFSKGRRPPPSAPGLPHRRSRMPGLSPWRVCVCV